VYLLCGVLLKDGSPEFGIRKFIADSGGDTNSYYLWYRWSRPTPSLPKAMKDSWQNNVMNRGHPYSGRVYSENGLTKFQERVAAGLAAVKDVVGRVWPFIVGGIAVGSAVHGYVPQNFMAAIMGKSAWWSVPVSVLIGIPLYSNAAGIIPIVQALLEKGASLGTALAFMMSVIGLSLPETIILKKVLKLPLILIFVGVVGTGIMIVGFLFNLVF